MDFEDRKDAFVTGISGLDQDYALEVTKSRPKSMEDCYLAVFEYDTALCKAEKDYAGSEKERSLSFWYC